MPLDPCPEYYQCYYYLFVVIIIRIIPQPEEESGSRRHHAHWKCQNMTRKKTQGANFATDAFWVHFQITQYYHSYYYYYWLIISIFHLQILQDKGGPVFLFWIIRDSDIRNVTKLQNKEWKMRISQQIQIPREESGSPCPLQTLEISNKCAKDANFTTNAFFVHLQSIGNVITSIIIID